MESVVSVLACIMMAAGNSSNGRCPATYFYLSTSGLVGKWYESVISVLPCIMMSAGNLNYGRCPATYFYSSTTGLVGKWLCELYLKLMNTCVR